MPVGINQYDLISKITPIQNNVNTNSAQNNNTTHSFRRLDTKGKTLSSQQEEYFADSKIRDKEDIRYSHRNKDKDNIYVYSNRMNKVEKGMKDEERAKVLAESYVKVAESKVKLTENEKNNLKKVVPYKFERFFKELGDKFGIYKNYKKGEIEFSYSKSTVGESINKTYQTTEKSIEMVDMMSCTEDIIANAIPISIHDDLYKGTRREDDKLVNTYVLLSAYSKDGNIYPVEIIAKERHENSNIRMQVTLNKIEADVIDTRPATKVKHNAPRSASDKVSVADIISHVNNEDGSFLKYIPDSMLSDTQVTSARESQMIQYAKLELLANDVRPDNKTISEYVEGHREELFRRAYEIYPKRDSEIDNNQYSLRDHRSNREILADALMSATQTKQERENLEAYQKRIEKLDAQESLRSEYVKKMEHAETAAERDGYEEKIKSLDKKIAQMDKMLLGMEAAAPLKAVIKREAADNGKF